MAARLRRCCLVGAMVAGLVACDAAGTSMPLPTSSWGKSATGLEMSHTALFVGVLALDGDGCLVGRVNDDAGVLVWPWGYTARTGGDGGVEVLDAQGRVVARTGYELRVGGGWFRPDPDLGPCVDASHDAFFIEQRLEPLS